MLALLLLNRMSKRRAIRRPPRLAVDITSKYCRTCLSTEDLVSIFYSKNSEDKRSEELKVATGLEIRRNDGLSQKICSRCIDSMNAALQFRRTSKKAEKALLNLVTAKNKKKLPKKIVKTPKVEKAKVEKVEFETDDYPYNYEDVMFEDDFHHDEFSYDVEGDSKPKIKQKPGVRKKRVSIPNQASYKCTTCNKEFRMKATYKAHMRFHTNYCVCESCGKRCRNNNQLQEHKRARHGLGRIHKCAYCEYSSATKEALTIHERRHTGERPYICDHCGATFHRRSNLVQHIAIHLPEKNFQCGMCPKRLKSRKFLQIHVHNAHTGKRYGYLCAICKHRFEKPNKVRAHTRRVHGLPDAQQAPAVRVQL